MHKVKNAIILAAGRGSRLKHLTDETPKPLLAPKGVTFIQGIIDNLKAKGINEIIIVTGYKKDKFNFLEPVATLVENKEWDNGNNITSIKAALGYIGDSLIINGDIIMESNVFQNEYPSSLTYVENDKNIDEWIVETNKEGQVINFNKNGLGLNGLYQREIIFVTSELANEIKKNIDKFDINEYQEYLMIGTANEQGIPFKTHEVSRGTIFDLDTVDEYEKYSKQ